MRNRIITVSREFGSGGRTIGKKVAEKLGIPCYDAELIHELSKESGFAEEYIKEAGEYTPGNYLSGFFANRTFGQTNEDILWNLQCKVISELAEKGSCVIIGAKQFLTLTIEKGIESDICESLPLNDG